MTVVLLLCLFATYLHPVVVAGCTVAGCWLAFRREQRGRTTVGVSVMRYCLGFFGGYVVGVAAAMTYSMATHERITWLQ